MAKVTVFGAAALAAAAVDEEKIIFTTMLIGDGNGVVPNFTGAETSLVHQVSSVPVKAVYRRAANPNFIYIDAVIPWDDGGYTIREAAVADENGNIIIIGKYQPLPKPDESSGEARQVTIRLIAVVSNQQITAISLFSDDSGGGVVVSSGSGFPIGYIRKSGFAGEKYPDDHGHEWLMVGLLHSKSGYEKAVLNPSLRSHGRQVFAASASTAGAIIKAADDGAGNIVVATGSLTHVLVSNDGGETVRAVPHNLPNRAVTVEYIGGQFVLAGNNSSAIFTSYSVDSAISAFSASISSASVTGATADTVRSSANGTVGALFVVQGATGAVYKTSGVSNSAVTLPAALGSYVPLIQYFAGAFYVAAKNISGYYKTINNGASFTTHTKPSHAGSVVNEFMTVVMGKFFWGAQSASYRAIRYTTDFVTWVDFFDSVPVSVREWFQYTGGGSQITVQAAGSGLVISTPIGCWYTTDLVSWVPINFSRSAVELAGSGASYVFHKNLVMGGADRYTQQGASLNSSVLKVDYSNPDYVGIHVNGIQGPDSDGLLNYVRIK